MNLKFPFKCVSITRGMGSSALNTAVWTLLANGEYESLPQECSLFHEKLKTTINILCTIENYSKLYSDDEVTIVKFNIEAYLNIIGELYSFKDQKYNFLYKIET